LTRAKSCGKMAPGNVRPKNVNRLKDPFEFRDFQPIDIQFKI